MLRYHLEIQFKTVKSHLLKPNIQESVWTGNELLIQRKIRIWKPDTRKKTCQLYDGVNFKSLRLEQPYKYWILILWYNQKYLKFCAEKW